MRRRIPRFWHGAAKGADRAAMAHPWRIHGASMAAQSNVMSVSCQLFGRFAGQARSVCKTPYSHH